MSFRNFALLLGAPALIIAACSGETPVEARGNDDASGRGGEPSTGGERTGGGSSGLAASGEASGGRTDASNRAAGMAGEGGTGGESGAPLSCVDPLALPLLRDAPATLAGTGLYSLGNAGPSDFAPYARVYRPKFEYWADGATKQRFVYLPACTQIDTSDMDYWKFPIGTRLWKEFREAGNGTLLETRFIHRYGPGENDWLYATYQWDLTSPTPEKALRVDQGAKNVNGTQYDIPSQTECLYCHLNLPEPPIGFSAIQLSHAFPGENLRALGEAGWLTRPATRDYLPPGDETASAALGYLHGNCGHCHNSYYRTHGGSWPGDPAPRMRLSVQDRTVEQTTTYSTLVWVGTANPAYREYNRIEPCNPAISSALMRMATREEEQMPPIASKFVDHVGVELVSNFIRNLHAPGAPACPE